MQESQRIVAAERAPRELLAIVAELIAAGVPVDVATRAVRAVGESGSLSAAAALCLDAMSDTSFEEAVTATAVAHAVRLRR